MVVGVNLTGRGEEIYEVANSAWKQLLGTKFLLICRQKRDSLVCTGSWGYKTSRLLHW